MTRLYGNMSKCKDDETVFLYPVINYEIIRVATKGKFWGSSTKYQIVKESSRLK